MLRRWRGAKVRRGQPASSVVSWALAAAICGAKSRRMSAMSAARSTDSGGSGRVLQLHDVGEVAERGLKAVYGLQHHGQQGLHGVGRVGRRGRRQLVAQGQEQPFHAGNGRFEVVRGSVDDGVEVGVGAGEGLVGGVELLRAASCWFRTRACTGGLTS